MCFTILPGDLFGDASNAFLNPGRDSGCHWDIFRLFGLNISLEEFQVSLRPPFSNKQPTWRTYVVWVVRSDACSPRFWPPSPCSVVELERLVGWESGRAVIEDSIPLIQ